MATLKQRLIDLVNTLVSKMNALYTNIQNHKGDANIHVTSDQKLNWAYAYMHSQQPHAPSNAQKNVQSDWEQSDNSIDDFIKNKPTRTSQFINDGEDGTDKYAQLKDIYKGNALLSYGIINIPGTYQYDVWADKYIINGILYEERIEDTVTLSPADSTYDRIDRIVINSDGDILVKEGIPAENPVSPDIDPATEVEVRFILVKANTAEPDINTIQVYDENLGSPNEWDSEVLIGTLVDFENTEYVSKGTKSLKFGETLVRQRVRFIAGSFIELNTIGEILFDIRTTSENPEFSIKIGEFPEIFIRNRIKGFLADGNWHTVSISAGELRELNPDYNGFDQIYLQKWDFPTPVWFDNIRIIKDDSQGGGTTPTVIQRTSDIPINDGATGVSKYVEEKDLPTLSEVAKTGEYADLLNAPGQRTESNDWTIPVSDNRMDVLHDGKTATFNPAVIAYPSSFSVLLSNKSESPANAIFSAHSGWTYHYNKGVSSPSMVVSYQSFLLVTVEGSTKTVWISENDAATLNDLEDKQDKFVPINTDDNEITLLASQNKNLLNTESNSSVNITVNTGLETDTFYQGIHKGTGVLTFVQGSGMTILTPTGKDKKINREGTYWQLYILSATRASLISTNLMDAI